MTTRIISIAIAAGLVLGLASPAKAHDEIGVALYVAPAYIHYEAGNRDEYRHRYDDSRLWHKHEHRHKKLHRHYRHFHDRWHRANDHRRDRYYWRDHAQLHRGIGLDQRYTHRH